MDVSLFKSLETHLYGHVLVHANDETINACEPYVSRLGAPARGAHLLRQRPVLIPYFVKKLKSLPS